MSERAIDELAPEEPRPRDRCRRATLSSVQRGGRHGQEEQAA